MTPYTVEPGDCLSSIAHQFGFTWQVLWNDPSNAELRSKRKNPNVLFPGDVVNIPSVRPKEFRPKLNAWNQYVVRAGSASVRIRLTVNGAPLANVKLTASVDDGPSTTARTDDDGRVEIAVSPTARNAVLTSENGLSYRLELGGLDPIDTPTGLQARLAQLGYYWGRIDGVIGPASRAAISAFQQAQGLSPTGSDDDSTRQALERAFGC